MILTRIVVLPAIGLGLTTAFKHVGLLPDDPVRFYFQRVSKDIDRGNACFGGARRSSRHAGRLQCQEVWHEVCRAKASFWCLQAQNLDRDWKIRPKNVDLTKIRHEIVDLMWGGLQSAIGRWLTAVIKPLDLPPDNPVLPLLSKIFSRFSNVLQCSRVQELATHEHPIHRVARGSYLTIHRS